MQCRFWFLVAVALPAVLVADAEIVINEFMAGNDQVLCDEDGNDPDWLELHNAGDEPVDLAGWFLSDEVETPDRWRFPAVSLAPGEYLLVYLSGKDRSEDVAPEDRKPAAPAQPGLHTNFRLNYRGEMVLLVGPGGGSGDIVEGVRFGQQGRDASTGRLPGDSDKRGSLDRPTPGRSNDSSPPDSGCPPRPEAGEDGQP